MVHARPDLSSILVLIAAVLALAPVPPADAAGLSCERQRSAVRLCAARTDNYKDCYNVPDGLPERRSWLAGSTLRVAGATYRLVPGQQQFAQQVVLRKLRGRAGAPRRVWVRPSAASANVDSVLMRVGPPASLWGPLLELSDRDALADAPVRIRLQVVRGNGRVVASTIATYVRDPGIAWAGSASPEYGGPGGRWRIGGRSTPTDVELGARHVC